MSYWLGNKKQEKDGRKKYRRGGWKKGGREGERDDKKNHIY